MQPVEQRDPSFWRLILADPDVGGALLGFSAEMVLPLLDNPAVLPLATEHGGYLFISRCGFGRVLELHSAYTRLGWGREALLAGKAALRRVFASGADLIFTHEQCGQWRTKPPKSFGFKPSGEEFINALGTFRLWTLSRNDWEASPACARGREIH